MDVWAGAAGDLDASTDAVRAGLLRLLADDLRRPVTWARGYAEVVATGPLDDLQAEALQRLLQHLRRIEDIVEDAVGHARAIQPTSREDLEAVPLTALLDRVLARLPRSDRARVSRDLGAVPVTVDVHPQRAVSAISHLVRRSLRASAENAQVIVRAWSELGVAIVEIEDAGPVAGGSVAGGLAAAPAPVPDGHRTCTLPSDDDLTAAADLLLDHMGGSIAVRHLPGGGRVVELRLRAG